jgi:hypothetical protein
MAARSALAHPGAQPATLGPDPSGELTTQPPTGGAAPAPTAVDATNAPVASPAGGGDPGLGAGGMQVHGFVSEGGFVTTSGDYIGASSSGSLALFEAALNVSMEVTDRLRAGVQLFGRDFGAFEDPPRFDWAFLDYRWRTWLGVRAGIVKMPFGLYNEYADIDSARLPILMPQGLYPFRNRDVLLAHRGFAGYGNAALGAGNELEYQVWLGTLSIPRNALELSGATLDSINTKYVTGAQAFWYPKLAGLRIGGTVLRASIDFNLTLSPENVTALTMAGAVPPGYRGEITVSQRPDTWMVASAEYIHDEWLFAAEYGRAFKRQRTTLPDAIPTFREDSEQLYGMLTYRGSDQLEVGGYYSVHNLDANDRQGRNPRYAERFHAFQRDLAATVRLDVNAHWLLKLEAHFVDGTGDLPMAANPHPSRYWGLFLFRTTVTF